MSTLKSSVAKAFVRNVYILRKQARYSNKTL